jgi:hypothetical protein
MKTDCFAYRITKTGREMCSALNPNAVCCAGCTFYKTTQEENRQREGVEKRLLKLGLLNVYKQHYKQGEMKDD